jgi:hypothetical protein
VKAEGLPRKGDVPKDEGQVYVILPFINFMNTRFVIAAQTPWNGR